jgi:hypothetical protein
MKNLTGIESVGWVIGFIVQLMCLAGIFFNIGGFGLIILCVFFSANGVAAYVLTKQLFSWSKVAEDFEDEDQSHSRIRSNPPVTFSPGASTSVTGRPGILSSPVYPPEAAEKLWARWRRASGSQNPGTLGSTYLERVNALINKGQRATEEEKNRSEWDWFELVYDELRERVRKERQSNESMSIFTELASEWGYSLITASSGEDYNSERHQNVGLVNPRKSVVKETLLPGLQKRGGLVIRSTALVTFRP